MTTDVPPTATDVPPEYLRFARSEAAMEAASARASDRSVLPLPTLPPAGLGGLGEEDESSLLSLTAWSRWCDYDYV